MLLSLNALFKVVVVGLLDFGVELVFQFHIMKLGFLVKL
jgi:hypothetical protein